MKLMLSPLHLWFIEYKFKMRKGPIPGAASSPSKGGCSSITGHCERPNSRLLVRRANRPFVQIPNKCWISKSLFRLVDFSGPICSGSLILLVYFLLYLLVPVGQGAEINGFRLPTGCGNLLLLEPNIKICVRGYMCGALTSTAGIMGKGLSFCLTNYDTPIIPCLASVFWSTS